MKIIHLNTLDYGGAAIAARRTVEAIRSQGAQAKILVALKRYDNDIFEEVKNSYLGRKIKWLNISADVGYYLFHARDRSKKFVFSPGQFGIDVSHHPDVISADIIHLHWTYQGFLSLNGIKKLLDLGKPVVWTLHDQWAMTGGCYVQGECQKYKAECRNCPLLRPHSQLALRQQRKKKQIFLSTENLHLIAIARWKKQIISQSAIFKNFAQIKLIPNPINTEFFKPLDKKQIRQKLGLNNNEIYIGFVAFRLDDPNKGFKYLAAALNNLAKEKFNKKINLMVIGKTNATITEKINLPIIFTGYISDFSIMRDYYNAMDVLVIASLQENLPNTVMEALACGTPVAGFEVGGIPDMVKHRQNGYLAREKDADDLANGIIDCLENKEVYGKAARQHIVQNFSYPVIGKKLLDFYKSII